MSELARTIQLFVEGKAQRTRQTYLSIAKGLEVYLDEKRLTLETLKPIHAKEIIYRQKAMNSRATYKKFLKALFRSIGRVDLVEYINDNLREVKEEEKFAVDLTLKEMLSLIDVTKQILFKFGWSLMAFDGLRPGEVLGLHFEDVDVDREKIILRRREGEKYGPKGMKPKDKEKTIPINPLSLELFKQIPQGRGRILPISYKTMRKWFNRYVKEVGIAREEYSVTMHKMRHFFGHFYNKQRGNIRVLKEIMRHSKIQYTLLYTKPSEGEIEEDFRSVWSRVSYDV